MKIATLPAGEGVEIELHQSGLTAQHRWLVVSDAQGREIETGVLPEGTTRILVDFLKG